MKKKSKSVLSNVLINSGENNFRLADIYFSSQIEKINFRNSRVYNWSEIQNSADHRKAFDQIPKVRYPSGYKIIDGNFRFLMPGGIDSHVHFNTPGYEEREDFEHGSFAAVSGGTTTVIDMPCTSIPPVVSKDSIDNKLNQLKNRSYVDFGLWGGVARNYFKNSKQLARNISEMSEAGIVGIKVYILSGMDTFMHLNYDEVRIVADIMRKFKKPIAVHAEDEGMVNFKKERLFRKNDFGWEGFCAAHNDQAEIEAVLLMDKIARITGTPIHIVHLSSELALKQVKLAVKRRIPLTAETCPHYLHFTEEDFNKPKIRNYLKTTPPVKRTKDKETLWEGLSDDLILFVTSDHAGCDPRKEKISRNFWKVYSGIPGVEHRVVFMLSEGFLKERITLEKVIKLVSENPANYFNLNAKGSLQRKFDADFALIDLWKSQKITSSGMRSKGKYTPFENQKFDAVVEKTFLRGEVVFDTNSSADQLPKIGKFVPSN